MAKEIQYSRISTKLQNLKAAHPQDVSAKLWNETFKGLINGGESMRLFDVFSGSLGLLEARNKRYMKWSSKANSSNWTSNWVQSLFEKYNIVSKFGPSTDASGKMVHPRKPKSVITITEAPVNEAIAAPEKPVAIFYAGKPVHPEQLSDEELDLGIKEYSLSLQLLQQEKEKRDALKAKKVELLKVFSEMAKDEGFSLEDLIGLV